MASIKTVGLTKKFKDLTAVDSVDLEIKSSELFGLLGPNGAGKTTFISMLSTTLLPTTGSATLNGFDVVREADKVRSSIGIVFQDPSLDTRLTAEENLYLHGMFYGMSAEERKERIKFVLELVDLWEKRKLEVRTFSGGMKRRLELARGLMHKPKVLFLDEPTLGLDPQTRQHIWKYIKRLNRKEKLTVILTTHYLEEADFLCDRVAIIDFGKIVALDTPSNLKKNIRGDVICLKSSDDKALKEALSKKLKREIAVTEDDGELCFNGSSEDLPGIVRVADKSKIKLYSMELHKPTLEDVFLHFTGRNIRESLLGKSDQGTAYLRDFQRIVR
ncbi:MAG TPA: ATP-binding cassette domain-containing protein [Candidatus Diapherotrites archaeon]|uniref:ATP-binding cassette domain-containing protein n=1 Tax=Candidatus Iainarchaeum sp. TaxID=3101447 RepID=A0A7J4IQT5_9ARCH|nr:ATP-binding cassette domain-containing protein [Candidatus Diapherotrites archaeon]